MCNKYVKCPYKSEAKCHLLGSDAVRESAGYRVERDVRHEEAGEAVDRAREESHERPLHRAVCTHIGLDLRRENESESESERR